MTPVILGIVGAILLVSLHDAIRRPILRRQALRNVVRRPSETAIMIGGALLGTAIITASFVIGDTIDGSIRDIARTNLGPIDDVVVVEESGDVDRIVAELEAAPIEGTDGVLGTVAASVVVTTLDDVPSAVPDAGAFELDFDAARAFGDAPASTGFADAGPTPEAGQAAASQALARELGLDVGDVVAVHAFGNSTEVEIVSILEQHGMAGRSDENLHLAPGTLDALASGTQDGPWGLVYVSRDGGVFAAESSLGQYQELRDRYLDDPSVVSVEDWKTDLLADAELEGAELTTIFSSIGSFAVISGILLVVNIVVMLTEERRSQLGIMRALGLRRGHVVRIMGLEGSVYAIASTLAGVGVGIGVGRAVTWAARTVVGDDLDLRFQFDVGSLVTAGAIGLLITLATVWAASLRLSRLNVIAAIRELPNPARVGSAWRRYVGVATLAAVGGLLTMVGLDGSAEAAMVGPPILAMSLIPAAGRFRRLAASIAGVASVVWGIAVFTVLPDTMANPEISIFVIQGVVLVTGAVMTVTANDWAWRALLDRAGSSQRTLPTRLGLTYPLARPGRTSLLLGMYALVLFTIAFMAVITTVFQAQSPTIAAQVAGGHQIHLDTNPTTPLVAEELLEHPDVVSAAGLSRTWIDVSSSDRTTGFPLTGIDAEFARHGGPELADWDAELGDMTDAWLAVAADPGLVAVDRFVLEDDFGNVDIGDEFVLRGESGAADRTVTVAAITSQDFLWNGFVTGRDTVDELAGTDVAVTRWYVATDATSAADAAARLNAAFIGSGVDAATFLATTEDVIGSDVAFIRILEAYLGLGLLIGVAGLGVVLVRAVRERRREIGMMRAMGLGAATVRRSFLTEALFLGGQGAVIGVGLGIVTGWQVMTQADAFGTGPSNLVIPWVSIAVITLVPVTASLLAAAVPARRAAAISPAVALRVTG